MGRRSSKILKGKEWTMPKKNYTPEQIINSLREAEVLISKGSTAAEAARHLGVSEQTY